MATPSESERRRAARFEMALPADLTITGAGGQRRLLDLLTRDVCAGGVFLRTGDPLPLDTEVEITLRVPLDRIEGMAGRQTQVRALGRVVRAQRGGMAVRFDVSYQVRPVRPRIAAFVATRNRSMGELLTDFLARELSMEAESGSPDELSSRPTPQGDTTRLVLLDAQSLRNAAEVADLEQRLGPAEPQSLLLLYNAEPSSELRLQALHLGLRGVLGQEDGLDEFSRGVLAVSQGELWYPRQLLAAAPPALAEADTDDAEPAPARLTRKEREVLALVAAGHTNQQIADAAFISLHTVKTHLYNIYRKLGVTNRLQATLWAASSMEPPASPRLARGA